MSTYLGDLMYPAETYIHNGEEKTRWLKCGSLFQNDQGAYSVKLLAVPFACGDNNWFRVFEPKQRDNPNPQSKPAPQPGQAKMSDFENDDIPF